MVIIPRIEKKSTSFFKSIRNQKLRVDLTK
jgi:hypothetical protein